MKAMIDMQNIKTKKAIQAPRRDFFFFSSFAVMEATNVEKYMMNDITQ